MATKFREFANSVMFYVFLCSMLVFLGVLISWFNGMQPSSGLISITTNVFSIIASLFTVGGVGFAVYQYIQLQQNRMKNACEKILGMIYIVKYNLDQVSEFSRLSCPSGVIYQPFEYREYFENLSGSCHSLVQYIWEWGIICNELNTVVDSKFKKNNFYLHHPRAILLPIEMAVEKASEYNRSFEKALSNSPEGVNSDELIRHMLAERSMALEDLNNNIKKSFSPFYKEIESFENYVIGVMNKSDCFFLD